MDAKEIINYIVIGGFLIGWGASWATLRSKVGRFEEMRPMLEKLSGYLAYLEDASQRGLVEDVRMTEKDIERLKDEMIEVRKRIFNGSL